MELKNSYSSIVSSSYSYNKNNHTNYLNFTNKSSNNFCNNCGKYGHMSYQCNTPITSIGIIAFRNCPNSETNQKPKREYLLIRRKDTLGYIDFIRGKYSVYNKPYILNMFKQMTKEERQRILKYAKEENTQDYGFKLWRQLWTNDTIPITPYFHTSSQKPETKYFKPTEEKISKEKFTILSNGRGMGKGRHPFHLQTLIDECQQFPSWSWEEPEWGFPKGRRDTEETDWVCALREFKEETGQPSETNTHDSSFSNFITTPPPPPPPGLIRIPSKYNLRPQSALMNIYSTSSTSSMVSMENKIQPITNLYPFEENFLGSNYKPYKHKYYLMKMDYHDSDISFLSTEVSKVAWKSYEECMELIRFYNIEKKQMLTKIHFLLDNFMLI